LIPLDRRRTRGKSLTTSSPPTESPQGTINRILRVLRAINRGDESVAFERVSEWDEVGQKMVSWDEAAALKNIGSP